MEYARGKKASKEPTRMSQEPELTSSSLPASPASTPGRVLASDPSSGFGAVNGAGSKTASIADDHAPQRIPRWLERSELFLRVVLRMYIGLTVCYAPWSRIFWDQNPLFLHFPTLSIYAANGAVRGIVSGLGLLNLWVAFQDAIRHRDE